VILNARFLLWFGFYDVITPPHTSFPFIVGFTRSLSWNIKVPPPSSKKFYLYINSRQENHTTPDSTPLAKTKTKTSSEIKTTINNMADKNTSTLQSYVDSATGAVQSALGSLTGNTSDQVLPPSQSTLLELVT